MDDTPGKFDKPAAPVERTDVDGIRDAMVWLQRKGHVHLAAQMVLDLIPAPRHRLRPDFIEPEEINNEH